MKKKRGIKGKKGKRASMKQALINRVKKSHEKAGPQFKTFLKNDLPEDIQFWRPDKGDHLIDIIPYAAGPNDLYVDEGEGTYVCEALVHQRVGAAEHAFICLAEHFGRPCPICEHRNELRQDGADDEVWKALFPSRRVIYNIVCYDTEKEIEKGVQVWQVAHFYMEKNLVAIAKGPERAGRRGKRKRGGEDTFIPFADPDEGKSVAFTVEPPKSKSDFAKYVGHKFVDRDYEIDEEYLDGAFCLDELLHVPTYEEVYEAYWGQKDKPSSKRKGRKHKEEGDEFDDMSKRELKKYIRNNSLDINTSGMDLDEIREAIREEEMAPDEDYEDNEGEYTVEEILGMKKKKLTNLIEEEDLDVDPDDYDDIDDLREAVIDEMGLDMDEIEEDEEEEDDGENTCPYDGTFGKDCETLDECDDCVKWERCLQEQERLKKRAKKKGKSSKRGKGTLKRRRR